MYCPMCFNDSLRLTSRGVVHLIINGRQRDAGRFLFNLDKDSPEAIAHNLKTKIEEFFEWYVGLTNKAPIEQVEICSSDVICENGCKLSPNKKLSVVDLLISSAKIKKMIFEAGEKYNIPIALKEL